MAERARASARSGSPARRRAQSPAKAKKSQPAPKSESRSPSPQRTGRQKYESQRPWSNEENTEFFSRPHTVSALLLGIGVMIWLGFSNENETNSDLNKERGVLMSAGFLIFFCSIQLRDGPFTRPHPVFWRAITGCSLVYLLGLIYIFFQNLHDARLLMRHIDSKLGKPLPERSYGEACDLYTPNDPESMFRNLMDTVNDEFVLAHLFGWWAKALLLRDYRLAWVLSIGFELLEVTLRHQLPNFHECWWDHVLLDVLICNAIGIYVGLKTLKWLEMREYNWSGIKKRRSSIYDMILPEHWTQYKWEVFSSWRRFRNIMFVMIGILLAEVAGFYLKFILWIPPPHFLNVTRLILWWFCGLDAVRVVYQHTIDGEVQRIGTQAWIILAMLATEYLVIFKFSIGMFTEPMPNWIFYSWIVGITIFVSLVIFMFWRQSMKLKTAHLKN